MGNLSEIIDSLESNVAALLARQAEMRKEQVQLERDLEDLRAKKLQYEDEIAKWQEKCRSLKLVNSLLGSDQYKRETKLKINALIREIDQCIAQLSE